MLVVLRFILTKTFFFSSFRIVENDCLNWTQTKREEDILRSDSKKKKKKKCVSLKFISLWATLFVQNPSSDRVIVENYKKKKPPLTLKL